MAGWNEEAPQSDGGLDAGQLGAGADVLERQR
jgi:hypothetical protein